MIGGKPNPNLLPLTLFFGVAGPFTVELSQVSGYYCIFFFIKGSQTLADFPCIQCYGRQQRHTLFAQTESDRYATQTDTWGRCFTRADAFSSEIHSASCELKENDETQRQNINYFIIIYWYSLASLGVYEYTPLDMLCYLSLSYK